MISWPDALLVGEGGGGTGGTVAVSVGTGGAGGLEEKPPCHPTDPVCNQVDSECLALHDNSQAQDYSLRISQLSVFKPATFKDQFVNATVTQAVTINLPMCNLDGSGTMSWLLNFNEQTNIATFGVAKRADDPSAGYSYVNEIVMTGMNSFLVEPVQYGASIEADGTVVAELVDSINMPIYIGTAQLSFILLPLHKVRIFDTVLSADHNCIGKHNAEGLSPADGCLPNPANMITAFVDGGKIEAYILLEEADDVQMPVASNQTLCVFLSGDASTFGVNGKCKRINGKILFQGDWCSVTNSVGDFNCHDAMAVSVGFAASAVKLLPTE